MHLAERVGQIQPFYVMQILARAKALEAQGRDVVHMEVGEPDFPTPEPIVEAGVQALQAGQTKYTPAQGIPELRQALADYYQTRHGAQVDPERIFITPGASGALQLTLSLLLNPGDEVLLSDPGYPCNRHFIQLLNGVPRPIEVDADSGFQPQRDSVEAAITPSTRALLITSPSNPTGTLMAQADQRELLELCRARDLHLIMDEIYLDLTYGAPARSIAAQTQEAFIVGSFSKYFGMTGWRLGWVIVPDSLCDAADRIAQNIFLSAPTVAQYAALAAFEPATLNELEQRRQAFAARRDYLYEALETIGFGLGGKPEGAFYIYANCQPFAEDSAHFCHTLLEQAQVAVTPGVDFGDHRAREHIRFAYTTELGRLREGVSRIKKFITA